MDACRFAYEVSRTEFRECQKFTSLSNYKDVFSPKVGAIIKELYKEGLTPTEIRGFFVYAYNIAYDFTPNGDLI